MSSFQYAGLGLGIALVVAACERGTAHDPGAPAPTPAPVITNPIVVEAASASTFEGSWEGTVGSQRMRSALERARMEPRGEQGLFSFGIGCRVPYEIDDRGPFEGKPGMCVLALQAQRTEAREQYALMFAEPPSATVTFTTDGLAIDLRGVEDDTGEVVQLRFSGVRAK